MTSAGRIPGEPTSAFDEGLAETLRLKSGCNTCRWFRQGLWLAPAMYLGADDFRLQQARHPPAHRPCQPGYREGGVTHRRTVTFLNSRVLGTRACNLAPSACVPRKAASSTPPNPRLASLVRSIPAERGSRRHRKGPTAGNDGKRGYRAGDRSVWARRWTGSLGQRLCDSTAAGPALISARLRQNHQRRLASGSAVW